VTVTTTAAAAVAVAGRIGESLRLFRSTPQGDRLRSHFKTCPLPCSAGQGVLQDTHRSEMSSLHRATAVRCPASDADGPNSKATRLTTTVAPAALAAVTLPRRLRCKVLQRGRTNDETLGHLQLLPSSLLVQAAQGTLMTTEPKLHRTIESRESTSCSVANSTSDCPLAAGNRMNQEGAVLLLAGALCLFCAANSSGVRQPTCTSTNRPAANAGPAITINRVRPATKIPRPALTGTARTARRYVPDASGSAARRARLPGQAARGQTFLSADVQAFAWRCVSALSPAPPPFFARLPDPPPSLLSSLVPLAPSGSPVAPPVPLASA
jgi:hypothetical protein